MSSGRLTPPDLDDRTWQDIVDEARALIPKYAPEWTDHNPSDLGITLIELFAWIVEGMIYRLNRVPEKNFIEFLNLIGITRDPATPARTDLTFTVAGPGPVLIPAGTQVATPQTETEDTIVFETDEDLNALPINLTHCLSVEKAVSPFPYKNVTKALVTGPLESTELKVYGYSASGLLLGFDQKTTQPIRINFGIKKGLPESAFGILGIYFPPGDWQFVPILEDQTESLSKDGTLVLQVPADWERRKPEDLGLDIVPAPDEDEVSMSLFWLLITIPNIFDPATLKLTLEKVSINSVTATNALTINIQQVDAQAESLGTSNGKPFQFFSINNPPLYKQPGVKDPYEHLIIQVREPVGGGAFGPWEEWTRVDDISKGDEKEYRCNPVTGEIMFGNFDPDPPPGRGNGRVPPETSEIRALTYRYVAGDSKGNVFAHTLNVLRTPVPGVISVINPGTAIGGSDQETVGDTKRRGPQALKNRFRAVTLEDYEYLAKEASTDVRTVRALPPRLFDKDIPPNIQAGNPWMYANLNRSPGRINVIIVPIAPETVAKPKPDEELILEVSDYLNDRRVATAMLYVSEPKYLPIDVEVDFTVWQRAIDNGLISNAADVQTQINDKISKFLHPLFGNIDGKGWQVGQHIFIADLFEFIMPAPDVGFIERLEIKADIPDYHDPALPWNPDERPFPINILGVWVQLADYELLCSGTHLVVPSGPPI